LVLLGNHDQAVNFRAEGFSKAAERAVNWTRQLLHTTQRADLRNFLAGLPQFRRDPDILYVHGSPRHPTNEYLFPEDIRNSHKMNAIAGMMDRYCFAGHTHVPGVFVEPFGTAGGNWQFFAPNDIDNAWKFNKRKTIVNVGSVGQPRDADTRACYVTMEGTDVFFHRLQYDVEATIAKMNAIPELSSALSERLREGR
jgi:diadenosine tetraphosphatase ApaH/serine/threonine PP2A family protein phosphatase